MLPVPGITNGLICENADVPSVSEMFRSFTESLN